MDLDKSSVSEFATGQTVATEQAVQLVQPEYGRTAYKGVKVSPGVNNTDPIYVGSNAGVDENNGLKISPSDRTIEIEIDSAEKIWIIGNGVDVLTWLYC